MCIRVKSVVHLLCLTSTLDGTESLPSMRSVNVCSEKALQSKENVCLKGFAVCSQCEAFTF